MAKPTDAYEAKMSSDFCEARMQRSVVHDLKTWWADDQPWKIYNCTTNKYIQSRASKLRRRFAKDDIREQLRTLEL